MKKPKAAKHTIAQNVLCKRKLETSPLSKPSKITTIITTIAKKPEKTNASDRLVLSDSF